MRSGINDAFLDWLRRRRRDRPFFAFLNYFDAHEPYVPPPGFEGRFGIRPRTSAGLRLPVRYYEHATSRPIVERDILLARDCYDDCIAFLDEQLGRLLDELRRQGLLDNTMVIITSDHGEAFGDHGHFGHAYGVYLDEIGVPLVILARAPRRAEWWRARQPARLAGNRGRPARALGGLAVPRPLVGGLLARHPGKRRRESPPQPSPSR